MSESSCENRKDTAQIFKVGTAIMTTISRITHRGCAKLKKPPPFILRLGALITRYKVAVVFFLGMAILNMLRMITWSVSINTYPFTGDKVRLRGGGLENARDFAEVNGETSDRGDEPISFYTDEMQQEQQRQIFEQLSSPAESNNVQIPENNALSSPQQPEVPQTPDDFTEYTANQVNQMDPDNVDPFLNIPDHNLEDESNDITPNPPAASEEPPPPATEPNLQGPENIPPPQPEDQSAMPAAAEFNQQEPPIEGEAVKSTRSTDGLRFLTLGSSVTWGAGMEVRYFAYPYLLTDDRSKVTNLAVRAAGPKYPSVCIQSMVSEAARVPGGSEEYDVI
eukprot:11144535-Ditylum_brightwellii.AAC.1